MLHTISLQTQRRSQLIDITSLIEGILQKSHIEEGVAIIYCPHTTAGITINENADPDVGRDILRRLEEICPWDMPKDRHGEGNSAAHLKASLVGSSQSVIIHKGRLLLGRWQGVYFCEFDGPRARECFVKVINQEVNTTSES